MPEPPAGMEGRARELFYSVATEVASHGTAAALSSSVYLQFVAERLRDLELAVQKGDDYGASQQVTMLIEAKVDGGLTINASFRLLGQVGVDLPFLEKLLAGM